MVTFFVHIQCVNMSVGCLWHVRDARVFYFPIESTANCRLQYSKVFDICEFNEK